ncbi:MAG: transrane prediction [Paenibacillus sp.]|jgi:L-alanine-DL-glutamate epimerase-like enolase superfamily enzyme|nr:transrane prediction [Paenibacillus sp.]
MGIRLDSDIAIRKVEPFFYDERCRTPIKFGAVVLEESTFCMVRVQVQNRKGMYGEGWGAILLADTWCFPTPKVSHSHKDLIMRMLVERIAALFESYDDYGHPVDIFARLEQQFDRLNRSVCSELHVELQAGRSPDGEPFDHVSGAEATMPYLGALVCASPIDAAIHDAFGNVNRIDTYLGYGKEHMAYDLESYLGPAFKGAYIGDFLRSRYKSKLQVFHLVGGLDKLTEAELDGSDPRDGLPVSLDQWIRRDGLTCLKIKLRGNDLLWDIERIVQVASVARETQGDRVRMFYSLDTNEQCRNPEYVEELLIKLSERSPQTFADVLYMEQPVGRDLRGDRFDMGKVGAIKPMILDESLVSFDDFHYALDRGWTGIALKTCKCHSKALLFACLAEQRQIPYTVQDLSNPGIALVHSVGLAARLNTIAGVEANSVQFFSHISEPESHIHSSIFRRSKGFVDTASIAGTGLGLQCGSISRALFRHG